MLPSGFNDSISPEERLSPITATFRKIPKKPPGHFLLFRQRQVHVFSSRGDVQQEAVEGPLRSPFPPLRQDRRPPCEGGCCFIRYTLYFISTFCLPLLLIFPFGNRRAISSLLHHGISNRCSRLHPSEVNGLSAGIHSDCFLSLPPDVSSVRRGQCTGPEPIRIWALVTESRPVRSFG